jgi:hypothetical protein
MGKQLEFPTKGQIEKASREELARWYRFLLPETDAQQKIMDEVSAMFKSMGGMTPEVSKKIGHVGV